ncbi:MAG: hypothetical protein QM662_18045 [Gordonia sp. (in: high G+C Gram-positive bacteria)]
MRPLTAVHLPAIRDQLVENERRRCRWLRWVADSVDDPRKVPARSWDMLNHVLLWSNGTALAGAGLWWVTPDMATLAWHTAQTSGVLPDWDMTSHRSGLIVWDGGLPAMVEVPHDPPPPGGAIMDPPPVDRVRISAMSWHLAPDGPKLGFYTADRRFTVGGDEGQWVTGWRTTPCPLMPMGLAHGDLSLDEMMLRVLGATLLIAEQPTIAHVRAASWDLDAPPKSRRPKDVPAVKVIALREILHSPHDPHAAHSSAGPAREYTHRWIVRDHERTYHTADGPQKRWIAPYVAGPAHLPLVVKETVRVWRR